jgi:hypothetical protein
LPVSLFADLNDADVEEFSVIVVVGLEFVVSILRSSITLDLSSTLILLSLAFDDCNVGLCPSK